MSVLLLRGRQRVPLTRPGWLSGRMSFARAQAGGAMATHYDGTQWREDAADTPRFGPALKIEGQRTNSVRNPRCDGAVAGRLGSTGSLPTHWSSGTFSGCAVDIATASEGGFSALDITITPTGAGGGRVVFDQPSVSASTTYTSGVFSRLVGGSMASLATMVLRCVDVPSNAVGTTANLLTATGAPLASQRYSVTKASDGTATSQRPEINWTHTGAASPVTIRVAAPSFEQASFASTPTLPAVGSPAASTRGADLLSAPLNGARRGLVLWSGLWGQNAPSGADQMAIQVDGAADADRFRVRNAAGGATVVAGRVASSASADLTSLGNMTAGAMTSLGLAFDLDTGAYKAVLRGGTVRSGTGGPTSATRIRFGTDAAGASAQFGEIRDADFVPGIYPSDAELAARVNAMLLS